MRIVLVDKHEVVRVGIRRLFSDSPHQFLDAEAEAESVLACEPDLVVLEVHGLDDRAFLLIAVLQEKKPGLRVLVHTLADNPTYVARAATLGAWGYVYKGGSARSLAEAFAAAASNKEYPGILAKTRGVLAKRSRMDDVCLTPREMQVLRHLALGLSNKEISQSLVISVETVKEHVQHLLRKLGVCDRTQAAVWAVRKGFA